MLIVNGWAFDVPPPPPVVGLYAVTWAVPAEEISDADMAAVRRVEETKVEVRFEPFQRTTEFVTKFVPSTVSVKAGPPAAAAAGLRPVVEGMGFWT